MTSSHKLCNVYRNLKTQRVHLQLQIESMDKPKYVKYGVCDSNGLMKSDKPPRLPHACVSLFKLDCTPYVLQS